MLLTIPYQSLELSKLKLHPFYTDKRGRRVCHISYGDLHDMPILTPPLTLGKYDGTTNRLQFDTTGNRPFSNKWSSVQERILELVQLNTHAIFSRSYDLEEIKGLFQSLLSSGSFSIYAFPTTTVHTENGKTICLSDVKGGSIRCVVRIHGLILLERAGGGYQLRLQHSVPILWNC
jgi:hypothetical protein